MAGGKTGPAPKPPELGVIEGKTTPFRYAQPRIEIPSCPNWLGREAKREWKRIMPHLYQLGLITQLDRSAIAAYCQAYDRWYKAERTLTAARSYTFKMKSGYVGVRPEVSIAQKAIAQMISLCREFGLTPSARGRIQVPEGSGESIDDLLD